MNIFALHEDPWQAAMWLDDKRKNKMIVESCQLLSTAINLLVSQHEYDVYKTCFVNHPCCKWTRASFGNFRWLYVYTRYLHQQWGEHGCEECIYEVGRFIREHEGDFFPQEERTPFVNCAANKSLGISFKHCRNVHAAYRLYLIKRWGGDSRTPTWNKGERPWWNK